MLTDTILLFLAVTFLLRVLLPAFLLTLALTSYRETSALFRTILLMFAILCIPTLFFRVLATLLVGISLRTTWLYLTALIAFCFLIS